jgi:casein kinase 1/casein kinase I family protein HRR25
MESTIIANKYKLIEPIGKGAFGYIYKAINIRNGRQAALKMEPLVAETKMLKNETKIYQYLNGIEGIPSVLWFGVDDKNFYMAMDLLGPSLQKIRENSKPFSLELSISVTIIMMKRLESVHQKGLIHRDVKPDNFLFGLDEKKRLLHLIDFGFCKKYLLSDCITHIPLRENRNIVGTPNFVSINVHDGYEPSRRDDLESLAYIMLYLTREKLPWVNCDCENSIMNMNGWIRGEKMRIMTDSDTPEIIRKYFEYCRNLKFDETPDYNFILKFLKM